jgi:MoxR-like ATPase
VSRVESAVETTARLVTEVGRALEGKDEVTRLAVVTLLARGHLLVEDLPGVGKTTLARALDLLPADVLGGSIYEPATGTLRFRQGPIFTDVLVADEVNRATPRTQSALLEAMEERRVTLEGVTHALPELFFVVATQNPKDFHGTHPLPESQLDRFLVRMSIGYPSPEVERALLARRRGEDPVNSLTPVVTREALREAQLAVDDVRVSEVVLAYIHAIVLATRSHSALEYGASTRAALSFERAARARAIVAGRGHVEPDDVRALAVAVLAHRVRPRGQGEGAHARDEAARIVARILDEVPVPL